MSRPQSTILGTEALLRIFAGCARQEVSRYFLPNSCIASTAIAMDVLKHYGRTAAPWEVCVNLLQPPYQIELGCYPPDTAEGMGGHLVCLTDGFLLDASFGQIADSNPYVHVPPVFVGKMKPEGSAPRTHDEFSTPFGLVRYTARSMAMPYHQSLDWGPSPEREAVVRRIVAQIDGYCRHYGIARP